MARRSAEALHIEQLEYEIAALRRMLIDRAKPQLDMPVMGCGDSACVVINTTARGGQHTNGGCRCEPMTLRRALAWYRRRVAFLEETIIEQRGVEQDLRNNLGEARQELQDTEP